MRVCPKIQLTTKDRFSLWSLWTKSYGEDAVAVRKPSLFFRAALFRPVAAADAAASYALASKIHLESNLRLHNSDRFIYFFFH